MQMQEGNVFVTTQRGKDAPPNTRFGGSGDVAVTAGERMRISASAGRTISLGNFEFARVTVTVSASVGRDQFAALKAAVDEIIEAEEASLKGEESARPEVDVPGTDREIRIEYGMTVSLKRYESAKVDVGITQPISDDDDFATKLAEVQSWVGDTLMAEVEKVKPGSKGGVGI
jgi:hypothetical protein